jgi:hypothetical protein
MHAEYLTIECKTKNIIFNLISKRECVAMIRPIAFQIGFFTSQSLKSLVQNYRHSTLKRNKM